MEDEERTRSSRAGSVETGGVSTGATGGDGDDEPAPRARQLLPGAALGRYAVLGELGAGAMGVVYAAYDSRLERKVAIKVVKLDRRDQGSSGSGVPRLLREAQALARLSHPNVVPVFDVGSEGDRMFLAMELIEGQTLRDWLERRPRRWREILAIMIGAGRGLAAAHAAQIVHRDFKPDNVLIDREGRPRVTDFGLARGLQDEAEPISNPIDSNDSLSRTLTRTGSVMGTPGYMAPEQHFGRPAEPRSDQYAFCVSLYEALYGMRPFTAAGIEAVARQKWTNTIADPGSARPRGMPERLHRLIVRGLHRDPELRFATMDELLGELEALLGRRSKLPWLLAAGLATLVGVSWVWSLRKPDCPPGHTQLAGIWDPARTAEVEAAFAAAPTRASETTWPRVKAELDEHAARWAAMHEQLCRGGRDVQGAARLDAGMACLRARKGELAGVVDVLAQADRGTVHAAIELVDGLDDIEECGAPAQDGSAADDPARAAVVDAIAVTRAHVDGVQYARAIEHGEHALAEARRLGDGELVGEAEIELAIAHARSGHYDEAERLYTAAFWRAQEHGLEEQAFSAAKRMVFLLASDLGDGARASEWLRHAEAQLVRTGGLESSEHAALLQNAAIAHEALGHSAEAEEALRHALEIRKRTDAEDSRNTSMLRNNLGTMLAAHGRLEEALALHTLARANRVARLGPIHPEVAMSDINIANVLVRSGRYHEAIERVEEARVVASATMGDFTPMMNTLRSIRGATWLHLGRNELSHLEFQAVLVFRITRLGPDHEAVGNAWNLIGAAFDRPEDGLAALPFFRRAQAILDSAGEAARSEAVSTRMNIGMVFLRNGELAEAEELIRAAHSEMLRLHDPNHPDVALATISLARLEIALGNHERALELLERARAIDRTLGVTTVERAATKFHRARALWELGRDRPAAHALAREARVLAASDADGVTAELRSIDDWLAAHPRPEEPPK